MSTLKKIVFFLIFALSANLYALQETLELLTYYPAPYGMYRTLKIYRDDESTTQTNFTQALTRAGIIIETDYTADAYTPGIFWSTQNNNNTRPKAGIYLRETGTGTNMYFGTSNVYTTGITNNALVINAAGNIGIGTTDPTSILALGGDTARIIKMERRTASGVGQGLTTEAGGAFSGSTDLAGGNLILSSGISTGTGGSEILFKTATPGATGTTDQIPTEKMRIAADGDVTFQNMPAVAFADPFAKNWPTFPTDNEGFGPVWKNVHYTQIQAVPADGYLLVQVTGFMRTDGNASGELALMEVGISETSNGAPPNGALAVAGSGVSHTAQLNGAIGVPNVSEYYPFSVAKVYAATEGESRIFWIVASIDTETGTEQRLYVTGSVQIMFFPIKLLTNAFYP